MANPATVALSYSTHTEIINEAGQTGAYLETMTTGFAPVIDTIISVISRLIDEYTLRRFFTSTGDEVRTFDGPAWAPDFGATYGPYAYATWGWAGRRRSGDLGMDIVSVTTLALANGTNDAASSTYTSIQAADFYLRPVNRDGWPAQWLELSDAPVGTYNTNPFMWFSPGYNTIVIQGKFGWASTDISTVPTVIRNVCREETIRFFKGRDANFADMAGISEFTGPAAISKFLSARSRMMLDMYRRQPLP